MIDWWFLSDCLGRDSRRSTNVSENVPASSRVLLPTSPTIENRTLGFEMSERTDLIRSSGELWPAFTCIWRRARPFSAGFSSVFRWRKLHQPPVSNLAAISEFSTKTTVDSRRESVVYFCNFKPTTPINIQSKEAKFTVRITDPTSLDHSCLSAHVCLCVCLSVIYVIVTTGIFPINWYVNAQSNATEMSWTPTNWRDPFDYLKQDR